MTDLSLRAAASPEPEGERAIHSLCGKPANECDCEDPRVVGYQDPPASPPSPAPTKPCGCRHSTPGETLHPVFFPCPDHGSRKVASPAPSPAPEACPIPGVVPGSWLERALLENRERLAELPAWLRAPAPSSPAKGDKP